MEKIKNLRSAAIALFFAVVCTGGAAAMDIFFAFDDLMEDAVSLGRSQLRVEDAKKNLTQSVQALRDEANQLAKEADRLAACVEDEKSDSAVDAYNRVADQAATVNSTLRNVRKDVRVAQQAKRVQAIQEAPQYNLQTKIDEDKKLFVVTATLPGIAQDELKITVKSTDEFGAERQTLRITGEGKKANQKDAHFFNTSTSTKARFVNGRREEISVQDGIVSIVVDLPKEIGRAHV